MAGVATLAFAVANAAGTPPPGAMGCGVPVPDPDPNDASCHLIRHGQCVAPGPEVVPYTDYACGWRVGVNNINEDCGYPNIAEGDCQ